MLHFYVKNLMLLAIVLGSLNALAQGPKRYGPPIGVESAKKIAAVALVRAGGRRCFEISPLPRFQSVLLD